MTRRATCKSPVMSHVYGAGRNPRFPSVTVVSYLSYGRMGVSNHVSGVKVAEKAM